MGCTPGGWAAWLGTMAFGVPMWTAQAASLAAKAIRSPIKYHRKKDRSGLTFEDPFPGLEHRFLDVNGVRLHAVTHGLGTGKKLMLFLHGFPELWYSWRHQMQAFAGEYEVVAIDMRGYGDSERPKGRRQYWMDRLVGDVTGVVAAVGHERCTLVAHDWGGMVAWHTSANAPDVVERLVVLCCPHPSAYKDPARFNAAQMRKSWYFLLFQARRLPESFMSHSDFQMIDTLFGAARTPGAISAEDVERYKQALGREGAMTAAINYYRASGDNVTRHPIPQLDRTLATKLQMPVLLMHADSDSAFTNHVFSGHESHVANLTLLKLDNCSHWAQQDRPAEVISQMRAFLGGAAPPAAKKLSSNRGSIAVVRAKTPAGGVPGSLAVAPPSPRIGTAHTSAPEPIAAA